MNPNTTPYQNALNQVAKLLKLAQHSNTNPNEAANAFARAQEIMTRFKIEAASAQIGENGEDNEPIVNWAKEDAPLSNDGDAKIARWKSWLALVIARANQCKIYQAKG